MQESVKNIIESILKETLDFIISIPSSSVDYWQIALPVYGALVASAIYGFKRKK